MLLEDLAGVHGAGAVLQKHFARFGVVAQRYRRARASARPSVHPTDNSVVRRRHRVKEQVFPRQRPVGRRGSFRFRERAHGHAPRRCHAS